MTIAPQRKPAAPVIDYANSHPIALRLFIQVSLCKQCGRSAKVPCSEPMVVLVANSGRRTRNIPRSKYPFPIFEDLKREVVELTSYIEICERCFMKSDEGQLLLFPSIPRIVPRQFLPEAVPPAPSKPAIDLDYF